jgi:hypothetical protein
MSPTVTSFSCSFPMPEPISEVQLMVGDEEPGPLDTKLLQVGDDGELVGTLLQRLHLTEVDG